MEDIKLFTTKWNTELTKLKSILRYLHTYPEILKELKIEDLITPDELLPHQEAWLKLFYQYTGRERDFFKPHWIPIQRTTYNYFIDISTEDFPVFSSHFFPFEPYSYDKVILFPSIKEFMLLEDNNVNIDELKAKELDLLLENSHEKFKLREAERKSNPSAIKLRITESFQGQPLMKLTNEPWTKLLKLHNGQYFEHRESIELVTTEGHTFRIVTKEPFSKNETTLTFLGEMNEISGPQFLFDVMKSKYNQFVLRSYYPNSFYVKLEIERE
jgi:hypothetical protein